MPVLCTNVVLAGAAVGRDRGVDVGEDEELTLGAVRTVRPGLPFAPFLPRIRGVTSAQEPPRRAWYVVSVGLLTGHDISIVKVGSASYCASQAAFAVA